MNRVRAKLLFLLIAVSSLLPGVEFKQYFVNKTLRIDYFHTADAKTDIITLDGLYKQDTWAGNTQNLIDPFGNGIYFIKIYDKASNLLIYSKGFNSYCGEYKTTGRALKGEKETFHETAMIPFPRKKIIFVLQARDRKYNLELLYKKEIDPDSQKINLEAPDSRVQVFNLHKSGNSHKKVDLVIVAEGYTGKEEAKVKQDLHKVKTVLFNREPYKSRMNLFNLYGVFKPSQDRGCDEPTHKKFKNTVLSSSFNALGLYRYLLLKDNKALRNITASCPCDSIIVMVNSGRYGGGGIYNSFCVFTIDNAKQEYLLLHEFGHSFAGLADEYYSSDVAYNDFYPRGIEPLEPNITALLDKNKLKWKKFITPGVKIPTPWGKEKYENRVKQYHKTISLLRKQKADFLQKKNQKMVSKLQNKIKKLTARHRKFIFKVFKHKKIKDVVGAFLGAGYSSRGLYRPMVDCLMFSTRKMVFCTVCEAAVIRMINYYTE